MGQTQKGCWWAVCGWDGDCEWYEGRFWAPTYEEAMEYAMCLADWSEMNIEEWQGEPAPCVSRSRYQ